MSKAKILVIEDNPKNMKLMRLVLHSQGYQILEAADGEEGLNVIATERPDLIILDMQLPGISGLEVAQAVRSSQQTESVPILAVTAYAMKGDRERLLEAGCDASLPKPIGVADLLNTVERMLVLDPAALGVEPDARSNV